MDAPDAACRSLGAVSMPPATPEDRSPPPTKAANGPIVRWPAIVGLMLAGALAAGIVFRAMGTARSAPSSPDRVAAEGVATDEVAGGGSGGGAGGGTGTGIGPGAGDGMGANAAVGTAEAVAGSKGLAAGAPSDPNAPPSATATNAPEAGAGSPATEAKPEAPPPAFGFTAPVERANGDAPPPPPPPTGGGGGGGDAEFMGVRTAARKVVYVIDRSASMQGERFAHAIAELERSIEHLPTDAAFSVVFFSSSDPIHGTPSYVLMPPGRMMRASAANKRNATRWIRSVQPEGGTDPTDAISAALRLSPDAIFLMTDGQFDDERAVESALAQGNRRGKVSVSTIAFYEPKGEQLLRRIASGNRGEYRFVKDPRTP